MSRSLLIPAATLALIARCGPPPQADESLPLLQTFVEELVKITPGEGTFPAAFQMGSTAQASEQPVHRVSLNDSFAIARHEVPQNLYEAVMGSNPSRWKGPRNSVEMMSWQQAREFCDKLTARLREAKLIADDEVIRLPSEAEWEYCCRAGTTTAYSFGDKATAEGDTGNQASLLDPYGWHTGNAAGNDPQVGALKPNPWGLYDMHGYLREFTADAWHADYTDAPADGSARTPETGESPRLIVVRGGSWKDAHPDLRSASRQPFAATARDDAVGFRCVRARVR
jgi:formylglycine-generating enzyme required for sulfatase activity